VGTLKKIIDAYSQGFRTERQGIKKPPKTPKRYEKIILNPKKTVFWASLV